MMCFICYLGGVSESGVSGTSQKRENESHQQPEDGQT